LSASVGGAEIQDVVEEPLTQVGFDPHSDDIRADFIQPCEEGAPCDDQQNESQPICDFQESLSLKENPIDRTAEEIGLPDRQQTG
jgi:hypothetical protein